MDERGSNFLIIIVIVIIDYRFHQELISASMVLKYDPVQLS